MEIRFVMHVDGLKDKLSILLALKKALNQMQLIVKQSKDSQILIDVVYIKISNYVSKKNYYLDSNLIKQSKNR